MSGIAGAIDDAARETVRRATAAMTHRGPMVIGACQAARKRGNGSAPHQQSPRHRRNRARIRLESPPPLHQPSADGTIEQHWFNRQPSLTVAAIQLILGEFAFPGFTGEQPLSNTEAVMCLLSKLKPCHLRHRMTTSIILTLLAISTQSVHADPASRPNIIFIMADDLGYGDLGCYGQKQVLTPHLDRMAAEGVRFTDFYAGSTVCAPSRCVLMTGLNLGHCFIRGNGKINLRPADVTVAEVLQQAEYRCGLIGKWGLGHEDSTGLPTRQGFDYFYGYLDQHHAHNYYPSFLIRNEDRVLLKNVVPNEGQYGQGVATKKVEYSHDLIADEALRFIDRNKDDRFFLYLAMTPPHANNEARQKGMEIPDYGIYKDKDWPAAQKGTAAMISRVDSDVGKVLDRLRRHGIDENTIVFFTSDNGPHREGGNNPDFFDSNGPLRGIKRDLYEGGIRVPMIVRWPGHTKPGTTSDHIGYFGDLMATASELAGVKAPKDIDSISFLPAILGQDEKQQHHEFLYWEFYEGRSSQAVRMGDWKGVVKPFGGDTVELYNLKTDLGEQTDVAGDHPEIVAKIKAAIKKSHVPSELWKVRVRKPKKKQ